VYIYSMLRPCSSEIDDGLSLARQYGGRAMAHPTHHPKQHLELVSHSSKIHACYQETDVWTDGTWN